MTEGATAGQPEAVRDLNKEEHMPEASAGLSYEVFVSAQIPTTGTLPTGAPQLWSPMSATLISGVTDAVLVDPPFTIELTRRVGDWIERSGKRLTYIYITHGHGDHWFGVSLLVERFPGVAVYATEGTIRLMHESATGERRPSWDKRFPGQILDEMTRRYPNRVNPGTVWLNAQRMP